jgi:hypothetical protein
MYRALIVLLLAGCASHSEDIAPAYVSSVGYAGFDCQQLAMEGQRISSAAAVAAGAQDAKRSHDNLVTAVSVVTLFWPAMLLADGDGQTAAELAQLKGQMRALQMAATERQCGFKYDKQ